MSQHTVDVVVLGMGPGGEAVAGTLAEAGLDVVGIDERLLGGECPYWGCVPTKMMIRAAQLLAEARRIPGMAGAVEVTPDWAPVAQRIRDEATDDWDDRVAVERFEAQGGRFVRGHGRFVARDVIQVDGDVYRARRGVVVATGTTPAVPPIPGLRDLPYWTNHQIVEVKELPGSLVVLGGGAIGAELAQVMVRFGVAVTVVEALDRLVPPEEPEAGELLAEVFAGEGIVVRTGAKATQVRRDGDGFEVVLDGGDVVTGEQLLVATGRRTDLPGINAGELGIDSDARFLSVDGRGRGADGVWAVGDVTGVGAFTHVATHQARIVADDILGKPAGGANDTAVPRVTFTDPEIGSVGLTQQAAQESGRRVRVATAKVPSSARGWIHKAGNEGLIKLVEDVDAGVLVGATSMGPAGGEVLSMLTLAVHAKVPVDRLANMIYAYPTFHRAVSDAVADLRSSDG
jgi:pyruvate/2-oxoglutarate dehydrogenase complex dihydrolipoamide dehydrogenase (E3) component